MDKNSKARKEQSSRREFLARASGIVAASLAGSLSAGAVIAQTRPATSARSTSGAASRPNIVFVFSDQERYFTKWPSGLTLPAHERLQRTGVTFHNHYCPAVMCTSSRAVLLSGLQTADNRMFENTDMPYVKNLSTDIPTIGHMLRQAGYYTAYKGKWHLSRKFEVANGDQLLTKEMEKYGFADFNSPGDVVAHNLQSVATLFHEAEACWKKWLSRRSLVSCLSWAAFKRILKVLPLPRPKIVHRYITT